VTAKQRETKLGTAVSVECVSKEICESTVLSDISLHLRKGAVLALLGPNGAGKTTLTRIMAGLLLPNNGNVYINDEQMLATNCDELRGTIGVQSDGSLYEALTVQENLSFWGSLYGLSKERTISRIDTLLETFSLTMRRDSRVGELSKGLKQRVAVARAVLPEPSILLLDEPTAGLDPASVRDLYEFLENLRGGGELSMMIATHQLDGVEQLVDDVAILDAGRVVQFGQLQALIEQEWPLLEFSVLLGGKLDRVAYDAVSSTFGQSLTLEKTHIQHGFTELKFSTPNRDVIPVLVRRLVETGYRIFSVAQSRKSLEDLYFHLIGGDQQ